jgi:hypothetical protein
MDMLFINEVLFLPGRKAMPINFKYDNDTNTLYLKVTGILKSSEIIDYFNNLLNGNSLKKGFVEVVDLNETTDFVLRYSDLSLIEELTKRLNDIGQKATLMCGYNNVSKRISSMMMPLYQRADFEFVICNSEDDLKRYMAALGYKGK